MPPTPTPTPIVQDIFSTGSDSWAYQGTAQRVVDKGYVSLTDEGSPNTVGIVWLETTVTEPFTAEFSYNIGAGTAPAPVEMGWCSCFTRTETMFQG